MTDEQSPPTSVPLAPELSVIITCYYEEESIEEFYTRLSKTMEGLKRPYEIIFVNDGSTDRTLAKMEGLFEQDEHVSTVIDLFKNRGQTVAETAGLVHARGEKIVLMDSDLQLDPEELPLLLEEFDKGYDLVSAFRKNRKDPLFRRACSRIVNMFMRRASQCNLRDFGCVFKVIDARLIRAFDYGAYRTLHPVSLIASAQRTSEVPVTHHPRRYGRSSWNFWKLLVFAISSLVGVSHSPLQFLSVACFLLALLVLGYILVGWVAPLALLSPVTPGLILSMIVLNLLVTVGILTAMGELVIRHYVMRKRRPAYIIRTIRKR